MDARTKVALTYINEYCKGQLDQYKIDAKGIAESTEYSSEADRYADLRYMRGRVCSYLDALTDAGIIDTVTRRVLYNYYTL